MTSSDLVETEADGAADSGSCFCLILVSKDEYKCSSLQLQCSLVRGEKRLSGTNPEC